MNLAIEIAITIMCSFTGTMFALIVWNNEGE